MNGRVLPVIETATGRAGFRRCPQLRANMHHQAAPWTLGVARACFAVYWPLLDLKCMALIFLKT